MKGIIVKADAFSDDLMMLLDLDNAVIKVTYDLDFYNDSGTTDDLSDDYISKVNETFNITLDGVTFNTLTHPLPNREIETAVASGIQNQPSEKIFIKGGKYFAHVSLFGKNPDTQQAAILPIKQERRLISEANLRFYLSDLYANNPSLYVPERNFTCIWILWNSDYSVDNTLALVLPMGINILWGDFYNSLTMESFAL